MAFRGVARLVIFRTSLVIFMLGSPLVADGSKLAAVFTTRPKSKEAFVGDYVVFTWDYIEKAHEAVTSVLFGIVRDASGSDHLIALVKVLPNGQIYTNAKTDPKSKRITVIRDLKASFNISNLYMNDTGKFFCTLRLKNHNSLTEYVTLTVVDLQIDKKRSSHFVESWDGHKVKLACVVRVPKREEVAFTWLRQPNNVTVSRGDHHDAQTESLLTVETYSPEKFATYTCIAKTKQTTKSHEVYIRQLYAPEKPENLKQELVFDKTKGLSYQKVFWEKPKENGGAKVKEYLVEYKPKGIDWNKATRVTTTKKEYANFILKEGKKYDVRVYAINKVGQGPGSNVVEIKFGVYPSVKARSQVAAQVKMSWWFCLLNTAWILLSVMH